MKVIDPGHIFELHTLDDETQGHDRLRFVKRDGPGYPGNVGHHGGTNMQDVIRALISRTRYLDAQIPDIRNAEAIAHFQTALYLFEERAARRHGRAFLEYEDDIELMLTCGLCGHIGCGGTCRNNGGGCA
jgi:hypothetical protein